MDVTFFEEVPFYSSSSPSTQSTPSPRPLSVLDIPSHVPQRFVDPPIVYTRKPRDESPTTVTTCSSLRFVDPPLVYARRNKKDSITSTGPSPSNPPDSGMTDSNTLVLMTHVTNDCVPKNHMEAMADGRWK